MVPVLRLATYREFTYSHQLAALLRQDDPLFAGCEVRIESTWRDIAEAVKSGVADYGLIPLKNRWARTKGVPLTYRLLMSDDIYVHRLIPHRVDVHMAATREVKRSDIRVVHVMEVQVAQCSQRLDDLGDRVEIDMKGIDDTAEAMRRAAEGGHGHVGLGTIEAIRHFDLTILERSVQNPDNVTSFLLVSRLRAPVGGVRLVAFEIDAAQVHEGQAANVAQELFEAASWQAMQFWMEDKKRSKELNHMVIAEVSNPRQTSLSTDPRILSLRELGQASP